MRVLLFLMCALAALMAEASDARPNVVILLVDDGGFMDFGGYGGEASTPNINRIADQGVRFSNYHTSPLCAPSRAMLLTGLDNHRTGIGTIPEVLTEAQRGKDAYRLSLLPEVDTIADRLRMAGYQTYMTGKWHLGREKGDLPVDHGFDRSFILDASGADNWEQKSYMPYYEEAPWFEDGEPARLPDDFYSSRFFVDKMIEYLDTRERQQPFFSYVAFQAVHIPVQAPREFTENYRGVYSEGWDVLRQKRFDKARSLGLVPEDAEAPEPHPKLRSWDTLSPDEQAHYEASMMVNAGMLEAMDHHIGRLAAYLEEEGELENTLFVITSDNGPEFNEATSGALFRFWMGQNGYHIDVDRMGEQGYMGAIGPEWASAAAVPGALFKMYATEGGTRVPLIISGPGIEPQAFNNVLNFVTDIAPTIAGFAGIEATGMDGRSLVPVITGEAGNVYGPEEPVGIEVAGNSALFKGDYKLTRNTKPHGDGMWRLYHVTNDPAESRDLSEDLPELKAGMLGAYEQYAARFGVIELPKDFDIVRQVGSRAVAQLIRRNQSTIIGVGLMILLLLAAATYLLFFRSRNR